MTDTNLSIHNILCPTDFSELSGSAFAESVRLARWFGAKVTVVHVMPFASPIPGDMGYVPLPAQTDEASRKAALASLRHFVDAIDHNGVDVIQVLCREGDASDEIRKAARDTAADLVVMGTHGRSGFTRMVLGSVTEAVLNRPPAPVLTVNREFPRRNGLFRSVLCTTDVTSASSGTIEAALAIAAEGAARVTVLNVIEHGVRASGGALELSALIVLQGLIPDEARSSYRIKERVAFGEPDSEILAIAAEDNAELIVMGTRAGGRLGHLFGSTVRSVVRDAKCPVLVVPAGHVWPVTGLIRKESELAMPAGTLRD